MTLQFILFVYLGFVCYVILPAVFNFYLGTRTRNWSGGCVNNVFYVLLAYLGTALIVFGLNRVFVPGLTAGEKQFFQYYFYGSPLVFLIVGYYLSRRVDTLQDRSQLNRIKRSNSRWYLLRILKRPEATWHQPAADRLVELDLRKPRKNSSVSNLFTGAIKVRDYAYRTLVEAAVKQKTDIYNGLIIQRALEVLNKKPNTDIAESLAHSFVHGTLSVTEKELINSIRHQTVVVETEEVDAGWEKVKVKDEYPDGSWDTHEETVRKTKLVHHNISLDTLINRIRKE